MGSAEIEASMGENIFTGKLVRLAAIEAEALAANLNQWAQDSHYLRLLDSEPARLFSAKNRQEWIEKQLEKDRGQLYWFTIRTLADDRPIGELDLFILTPNGSEAFVGIGIGEHDFWGKGYGTDAMQVALRYAFTELNLYRVTLNVFEYNERAIRSYQKCGFQVEGRQRQYLRRDGQRYDMLYMGILRGEWEGLK
jgi:RimJ/RimL family protein N-acetyltransferase